MDSHGVWTDDLEWYLVTKCLGRFQCNALVVLKTCTMDSLNTRTSGKGRGSHNCRGCWVCGGRANIVGSPGAG
jgi:hypothetical protein